MKPGDRVICLDQRAPTPVIAKYTHWLERDKVYTVRDVVHAEGEIGITL